MKKIILGTIAIFLTTILVQFKVYATGGFSVSTQNITLHPGESTSFTIAASNSAGKIDLSSSDTNIASIDTNTVFLDLNSENITVTANNIGSTIISITTTSDFATYDEEILENQSYIVTVNVVEEPQPDDNPQDTNIIDDQSEQDNTKTFDDAINTPNTGDNSRTDDGSNQIILSSIIGAFFIIISFTVFCLYRHMKKTH